MLRPSLAVVVSALLIGSLPAQDAPKKYAVLVGVKEYDHSKLPSLQYPENDADELATLLKGHNYDVAVLSDTQGKRDAALKPTRENILKHLDRQLDRCKKNDTILVALAGHGLQFTADNGSYFCPSDAHPAKPETLVSLKTLYQKLDDSGAGVKLLLVDACRNDPDPSRGRGGLDGDTAPKPPRGVAALFSCSGGERAFENDKLKHGVFFHYVLQGLKGEAIDRDGDVTWDSLRAYVKREVSREVPKLIAGQKQHPNEIGNLSGEPPLLVKLGRTADKRPAVANDTRPAVMPKAPANGAFSFPMKVGTTWTYRGSDDMQFTEQVVRTEKKGDYDCAVIERKEGNETTTKHLTSNQSSALLHIPGDDDFFMKPKTLLKVSPKKGDKWTYEEQGLLTIKIQYEVVAEEEVTVLAGKFKAVKVVSVEAGNVPIRETSWYVNGKGCVKFESSGGLLSYSYELEKIEVGK